MIREHQKLGKVYARVPTDGNRKFPFPSATEGGSTRVLEAKVG